MITYPWPSLWIPDEFELRLLPNQRSFVGPYTPTVQVIDMLGERWLLRFGLPASTDEELSAAREAYFDRLKGQAKGFTIHHYKSPFPRGTLRSNTTIASPVAFLSNQLPLLATTGLTLLPGDMIGVNGQLFKTMEKATAVAGVMTVEVEGRARAAILAGATATLIRPTAKFIVRNNDGIGINWRVDRSDGLQVEAVEVW